MLSAPHVRARADARRSGRRRAKTEAHAQVPETQVRLPCDAKESRAFHRSYAQPLAPVVIRGAVPAVATDVPVARADVLDYAESGVLPSRVLVQTHDGKWSVAKGAALSEALDDCLADDDARYILVVNNVDRVHVGASQLADAFLSLAGTAGARAALDDVQISYSNRDGATVGPHTDSYRGFSHSFL